MHAMSKQAEEVSKTVFSVLSLVAARPYLCQKCCS